MKNKLAENLLRFGIKNLNESEVEKLQRLAEQDLDNTATTKPIGMTPIEYQSTVWNVPILGPCSLKYTPILEKAQQYWRTWLSSDITKQKFVTNHGWWISDRVDIIFKKYLECINKLKLVLYHDKLRYADSFPKRKLTASEFSSYAFVIPDQNLADIYVNCSLKDPDAYGTMIHEIQHLLYHIYPLNPAEKIGNVFLKPGDKKSTIDDIFYTPSSVPVIKPIDLSKTSKSLGVEISVLESWLNWLEYQVKQGNAGYICSHTEKASNIQSIRNLFNIKPGQNITYQMIKPYVLREKSHTDMTWILLCWAANGFKDINRLLSDMNKLAFDDTTPKDNNQTSGTA
jgi:hypothetical protein